MKHRETFSARAVSLTATASTSSRSSSERTFREIGDQYRLSRERIRQIQNSALDKLKKALEREHTGLFEN